MRKPYPIALAIGDLHLSLARPERRADEDWLETQASYLSQVRRIRHELNPTVELPILCTGDIFDRWNAMPELINFALAHLPDRMLSVPGQHDLPNHRKDLILKSGFGVLVSAQKIVDIGGCSAYPLFEDTEIAGFGWEDKVRPAKGKGLKVAVVHRYVWTGSYCFPGAPAQSHVSKLIKQLETYDAVFTGDNHIPFKARLHHTRLLNCGTFIRRKADEMRLEPGVGILLSDGSIERRLFDTSNDKFSSAESKREEVPVNMQDFIHELEQLGADSLDFRQAVKEYLHRERVPRMTREIILQAMESKP